MPLFDWDLAVVRFSIVAHGIPFGVRGDLGFVKCVAPANEFVRHGFVGM